MLVCKDAIQKHPTLGSGIVYERMFQEDFMQLGENMKAQYEQELAVERKREKRRWSMFGFTASAIGIVGIVVCGRMIFGFK